MNENFVIEWFRSYFRKPNLDEQALKPVLHFSLLWNLFEHNYFTDDRHLNPKRLIDLSDLSSDILSDECLNTIFNFFKERYFSNNHIDSRFETLGLSTNVGNGQESNYTFCHTVFTSNDSTKNDKIKATFLVMHRFRNNLFHGRKNPETLNIYEQAFREINKFLIHFIDTTGNNALINNRRQIL